MATVKRVGRYELGRTLGEGTFAKARPCATLRRRDAAAAAWFVLRYQSLGLVGCADLRPTQVKYATDVETQVHYAIKMFSREAVASPQLAASIKREIAVMKHVRHPNIVSLREVLASKTHIFIVLELVTGGELFDRIVTSGAPCSHVGSAAERVCSPARLPAQASLRSASRGYTSSS